MLYYTTRAFSTASRQYEAGDAIDPASITAAEWIRGTESGAVVPAPGVADADDQAARHSSWRSSVRKCVAQEMQGS